MQEVWYTGFSHDLAYILSVSLIGKGEDPSSLVTQQSFNQLFFIKAMMQVL